MATTKKTSTRKVAAKPAAVTAKPAPAPAPAPAKAAPAKTTVTASASPAATQVVSKVTSKPVTASPVAAKVISQSEWRSLVEQAAYYRAEKAGFSGNPEDHWDSAEKEVRQRLTRENIKVV